MRFCNQCGNQLDDSAQFCNSCGSPLGTPVGGTTAGGAGAQNTAYAQPQPQPQPTYQSFSQLSDWDGSVLDTIVNSIVASLIISFTCGIATPWAICYMYKFIINHATVDGKRLRFDGTGGELFGQWIKWLLLTIITCGIYGFWVTPRLYKWIVNHTHFE